MTGWAADAVTATSIDPPPPPSAMTSPGTWPSASSSTNAPDETKVRPARTASAQAAKDSGAPGARRAYVRMAPSGISDDILSVPPTIASR